MFSTTFQVLVDCWPCTISVEAATRVGLVAGHTAFTHTEKFDVMEHTATLKRHGGLISEGRVALGPSLRLLWDVDGTSNIDTPPGIVRNASVNL